MDEQITLLTDLGLNSYEAKAYLALLGRDSFTATQVADLSGVPRQRIYDILASLVERGLAISHPAERGAKYSAVAPSAALNDLLAAERARIASLEQETASLIRSLSTRYKAGQKESSPLEYIEVLRGATAINQRFGEIQANCRRELLIFTRPPYATPPEENEAALKLLARRVHTRSVYEFNVLETPERRRAVANFIGRGVEARFVARLPMKLAVVDDEIVIFAMQDPIVGRTELTIMVVENRQLAQLMKVSFEAVWEQGSTLEEACAELGLADAVAA